MESWELIGLVCYEYGNRHDEVDETYRNVSQPCRDVSIKPKG